MELYEAMRQRRSVRDFSDEPIPEETLKRIVSSAYFAPANDHFRDWHFVIVTDRELVRAAIGGVPKELTEKTVDGMTFISDPVQRESYRIAVPKQYSMLYGAAAVIIPLMKKKVDILHPANLSDLNCYASVWCGIENLWLAAASEGLGCCLRVPQNDEELIAKEALGVPEEYLIPCFIGIGRPKKGAVLAEQLGVDLDKAIHWQRF